MGFTSRSAFSRHKDSRENHLPSLDPKRKGFQWDTWQQDSADGLFLWHTLSAYGRNGCQDPSTGKAEGAVKHPYQTTPDTLHPTQLLPTTPTSGPPSQPANGRCVGSSRGESRAEVCVLCVGTAFCSAPAQHLRRQQSPSSSPWQGGGGALSALPIHGRGWWGIPAIGALAKEGFAKPDSYYSFRASEKLVLAPH